MGIRDSVIWISYKERNICESVSLVNSTRSATGSVAICDGSGVLIRTEKDPDGIDRRNLFLAVICECGLFCLSVK